MRLDDAKLDSMVDEIEKILKSDKSNRRELVSYYLRDAYSFGYSDGCARGFSW